MASDRPHRPIPRGLGELRPRLFRPLRLVGTGLLLAAVAAAAVFGAGGAGPAAAPGSARPGAGLPRAHAGCFIAPAELAAARGGAAPVAADLRRVLGRSDLAAAVVPHHLVAGHLPAGLFAYLSSGPPATLVVVGPDHFARGPRVGTSGGPWVTPAGVVEPDQELIVALEEAGLARDAWDAQDGEHSVGALAPLVAAFLPGTRIVPITLRREVTLAEASELGRFLRDWSQAGGDTGAAGASRRVFVVASVDFSHYLPLAQAEARDEITLDALRRGDWPVLFGLGPAHLDSPASLAVAMAFGGCLEVPRFAVAGHTNSAILLGRPDLAETTSHFLLVIPPAG